MVLDDFFEDVPNHRILLLHEFLGLLDGGAMAALFQAMIDERLEQFERHLLRQTALVQLQFGPDHDDRTAGIIDALAEQVLAETALLAFERVGERFERAIVGAAQHAAAAAVIEQRVHGFLQHALFVAHDHVRRMQLHQLLQPVVAVDDAAIEIVQIGSGETAAIQRHQRDAAPAESPGSRPESSTRGLLPDLRKLSTTRRRLAYFSFFCCEASVFIFSRISTTQRFDIDLLQQFLDSLGAHHGDEFCRGIPDRAGACASSVITSRSVQPELRRDRPPRRLRSRARVSSSRSVMSSR